MSTLQTSPERRVTNRVPVSIQAVLYYNSLMLPECQIRDLSPHGAFVFTDGHHLPDQASVDLAFNIPGAGGMPQRFSAQVKRSTDDGVGVSLELADPGALRRLIETLYAA
jgi:PilZ domain